MSKKYPPLVVNGVEYKIRYFTEDKASKTSVRAVVALDWKKVLEETGGCKGPLQGSEGDEWAMREWPVKVAKDGKIYG